MDFINAIEVGDRVSGLTAEVLLDAHGGRLSIANREGGGALVTVWLPSSDLQPP